ncbi:unnamed protein product [Euphydryas editha]|uniref:Uncharacterized protein n=1 Tax=Euphydryas editha TaxID=104508 RepID=A0AAU9UXS8_EUPED|nr:unnamed protein product [Euphydryas editha]
MNHIITLLKMMETIGYTIGHASYDYAPKKDEERIANAVKASKAARKEGHIWFVKKTTKSKNKLNRTLEFSYMA